jgi:hypothetical protein
MFKTKRETHTRIPDYNVQGQDCRAKYNPQYKPFGKLKTSVGRSRYAANTPQRSIKKQKNRKLKDFEK